jgi:hypothetical protein
MAAILGSVERIEGLHGAAYALSGEFIDSFWREGREN